MPIKSYLVFPHEGRKQELMEALDSQPCEVMMADNRNVLVLVSDTDDQTQEDEFLNKLHSISSLDHFTLVSGFSD